MIDYKTQKTMDISPLGADKGMFNAQVSFVCLQNQRFSF